MQQICCSMPSIYSYSINNIMKRYFLTAFAIAIGSLAIGPTRALAVDPLPEVTVTDGGTVNVPFATVAAGVLPSCVAVPTPGVLVQSDKTLTSTGGIAGEIVLTCTVGTTLSAGTPTAVTGQTPAGVNITGATTFSSTNAVLSETDLAAGINIVDVNMSATTTDDVITAGVYAFTVPVTVTYD